jgi:hypothetical protein
VYTLRALIDNTTAGFFIFIYNTTAVTYINKMGGMKENLKGDLDVKIETSGSIL